MAKMKSLTFNNVRYEVVDADSITSPDTANVGQTIVVKSVDKNNKPIEWKAVDFPQGGGGSGTGGIVEQVQSDWNETDTTSPAYIKNKPFGEYEKLIEILPLTQYDNFLINPNYGIRGVGFVQNYKLTIGETYRVFWDGIEYECVAQDTSAVISNTVCIGNVSAFGFSGNNEPFFIVVYASEDYAMYASLTDTEDGNSHSVGIYKDGIITKTIDSKYLPEINPLPEVTTSDAGKFLRVSNYGNWVAESIPNAEEASF